MSSAGLGGIGGIKGSHTGSGLTNIILQIGQGSIASLGARGQSFGIIGVVEACRLLCATKLSAIVAYIENLTRNVVKETEKAAYALGNVGFAYTRKENQSTNARKSEYTISRHARSKVKDVCIRTCCGQSHHDND